MIILYIRYTTIRVSLILYYYQFSFIVNRIKFAVQTERSVYFETILQLLI